MNGINELLETEWTKLEGCPVLSTTGKTGIPNTVYVGEISYDKDINGFIIADNYFNKTRKNIDAGSKGSVLFLTTEGKAYQIKGEITDYRDGEIYDKMLKFHNPKHPGNSAVVVSVDEAYSGADKLTD